MTVPASWQWQWQAACRSVPAEAFFPSEGESRKARERGLLRAKAICQVCPVIDRCREYALRAGEQYGVWGGLSEEERQERVG